MDHPQPTKYQRHIAALLGIDVSNDTQGIAAAKIEDVVYPAINANAEVRAVTPNQLAFAKSLEIDVSQDSLNVAAAKIADRLAERNEELLDKLQLKSGDKVIKHESVEYEGEIEDLSQEYIVSSIGRDGRIYFKGGNGRGAWPDQVTKVVSS